MGALANFPQQPELRAFPILDQVPAGCLLFQINNRRCQPILEVGEWVAVDPADNYPQAEELFLIRWIRGEMEVLNLFEPTKLPPKSAWHGCLFIGDLHPAPMFGRQGGPIARWGDGPYKEKHLREKIVGRVVGIFQPPFEEPKQVRA